MLIGDVMYYSIATGERLAPMDTEVSAEYARRVGRGRSRLVQWSCRNGDLRDVRWFHAGRQISTEEANRLLASSTASEVEE